MLKTFMQFINEAETHEFGCMMLDLEFPELTEIQNQIDKDDLCPDHELKNEPHVTLLYGFHENVKSKDAFAVCLDIINKTELVEEIILTGPTLFENENFDVLKFDTKHEFLNLCNKELSKFPNSNTFPTYKPHVTIAYLKPGMGKKYVDKLKNTYNVKPECFVYSKPSGERIIKKLTKNN